jgi:hypothetical protein
METLKACLPLKNHGDYRQLKFTFVLFNDRGIYGYNLGGCGQILFLLLIARL